MAKGNKNQASAVADGESTRGGHSLEEQKARLMAGMPKEDISTAEQLAQDYSASIIRLAFKLIEKPHQRAMDLNKTEQSVYDSLVKISPEQAEVFKKERLAAKKTGKKAAATA